MSLQKAKTYLRVSILFSLGGLVPWCIGMADIFGIYQAVELVRIDLNPFLYWANAAYTVFLLVATMGLIKHRYDLRSEEEEADLSGPMILTNEETNTYSLSPTPGRKWPFPSNTG